MVGGDQVGPEIVEIGIDIGADIGPPGAVMDVAGAWQGDLGRPRGHRRQEAEIVRVARPPPFDTVDHFWNAHRGPRAVPGGWLPAIVLGELDLDARQRRRGEGVGIGGAAEFAVGHYRKPDRLLQGDDIADRRILGRRQRGGVDFARVMVGARRDQRGRADQAADMFGAKRRVGGRWHIHGMESFDDAGAQATAIAPSPGSQAMIRVR